MFQVLQVWPTLHFSLWATDHTLMHSSDWTLHTYSSGKFPHLHANQMQMHCSSLHRKQLGSHLWCTMDEFITATVYYITFIGTIPLYPSLYFWSIHLYSYIHLWLEISVYDPSLMHEADSGHQALHQLTGLPFSKQLLSLQPLQELTPTQQLHYHICVILRAQIKY